MNKLFEAVDDLFNSDEDIELSTEVSEETLDEAINRAYGEEFDAISTYETILGKIDPADTDLIKMITEIKDDEEDHKLLLEHFIETGEVWTDEDLKKLDSDEDKDDESDEEEDSDEDKEESNEDKESDEDSDEDDD